ncbi:uncharacterized protein LOC121975169 isoform X1 [Zingiber officinale]|uniref:uncharacterized protein LOC121975169 isoform X1 n=1 Tax=Zingiber officinale TaxID=94328 RepID=UPI001C4D156C|nr:uncharacterized protein LOC121975169 isoform X1 [Zingiber officinale]XP_042382560.1 uncharacterized protein LOC121975169 isoform X1 [Zingiber officinale]XP_042382561.1 uncharacterized protein LOC121975169 isoform X1 [Zingiber officinale]XP_042382562.1 uncharacterized protein LOC121975169 isoform X1 [Zingiber officinale]XP_042382563.1 uncharacterized protein LOC121975169 isoform X1 [Zingiber officinale]
MEDIFLVGQESSDEKLTSSHSQKNSLTNEDDNRFTLSEGQVECDSENLSSKVPLIMDIKDLKSGRCLIHKSRPRTSQPIFANSSYVTSTSNGNAPLCIHSAKLSFDSFHILCRKSSLSSIPSRHTLYGYSPNFKQRVKSRSVCSLTDLIVECSPTVQTGNLLLHPSTGLLLRSVNETLKRKVLTKSAVDFQSALQDGMKQIMTKTISVSGDKTMEELISHERHFCCSSSNSKSLCQSNSSNSALLQCVWENRYPFFLFSVGKDHGKSIYVASPHDTNNSSIDKALDYIYLFHTHTEKIKESNHSVSNLVAKMKVRSFLLLGSGRPNCTETEFVLSAANEDLSSGLQTFTSSLVKSKELPCRLSEIFRLNRHSRSHSIQKVGGLSSQFEELQELHTSKLGMIDEAGCRKVPFADFPRCLELAAIVVKTFSFARNEGASSPGGWGLKFLEKGEVNDASASRASLCSSGSKLNEHWRSDINVNVLIPAGIHGGPISGITGPSGLIDRWMSNGQCDCSGWDVGCPLTVLNNNSEEDSKSLNLTMEGAKGEPVFEMCCLNKDLYDIHFQPSLSALQSFSIAVAIVHSQIPSLYPKWHCELGVHIRLQKLNKCGPISTKCSVTTPNGH